MSQTSIGAELISVAQVQAMLRERREVALVDLREEADFAEAHPLWAANVSLSRLELDAWSRIPRRDVPIVLYGDGLVEAGRRVLARLGYTDVRELAGGLGAWAAAGGELFRDVNVPSKAFGELVESVRSTPSWSAEEVLQRLGPGGPVVVDVRRPDEYRVMSIPTATSLPGGELVLRIRELAPDPATPIVVNCAGRTRSIIGTQSLINAGVPNPVVALRNGTIGWTLAEQELDHGADRFVPTQIAAPALPSARHGARAAAVRAGVRFVSVDGLAELDDPARTVYRIDVRTEAEYRTGHLPGFLHKPGGQLVQETDHVAAVRGARLVLADDDGVRAPMAGSWLAQMGWETWVVEPEPEAFGPGFPEAARPEPPAVAEVDPQTLASWLRVGRTAVVDLAPGREYRLGHVPGAWYAVRSVLQAAVRDLPDHDRLVLTSDDGELARWTAAELEVVPGREVVVLAGGTGAWRDEGHPLEREVRLLTPETDRYRRPYEGSDVSPEAMQAYLDWEYGLVAQLERDGTHHFTVI